MPAQEPRKNDFGRWYARATSLAFTLPAAVFVGYLIGYVLDRWLGTGYLKVIFLILGAVAGFVSLIREINRDRGT